jgi:hypothetical protein
MAGKVLAIIALAVVVGFMGCPTTAEEEDEPENLAGIVRIDGEPSTGNSLTVNTQWVINKTGDPAYVWKRGDQASGPFTAISESTGASYTVAAGDDGKYIQVTVSYSGNEGDLSSDPLGPVGLPRLGGTVSITGTLKIGETLTADITELSGQSGNLTYVWERGDGTYETIAGASAATYTLTDAESGMFIRVKVSSSGNSGDIISVARGQVPVPLTADISFVKTQTDTANTVQTDLGGEGANQTWTLTGIDQSPVYFGVQKTADQIITVSGTDAAKVSQAAIGQTVDGSTATHNLGVFGVNVGDLLFEGTGTKEFTLHISELGKASRAIAVSLNIIPQPKTGVAVFKVLEDPTPKTAGDEILERVLGIKHFDMEAMAFETASTSIATNLLDALAWIDRNAEAQGDYLVRVEQDETLPQIRLSCLYREVKIRLRGSGGADREISHDDTALTYSHTGWFNVYGTQITSLSSSPGGSTRPFIAVGAYQSGGPYLMPPVQVTLQLEDKITLKGQNKSTRYREMILVAPNCTLIMLDGAIITDHTGTTYSSPVIKVSDQESNSTLYIPQSIGFVYMYGGAIKNNIITTSGAYYQGVIYFPSGGPDTLSEPGKLRRNGFFVKEGGSITGNIDDQGNLKNVVRFVSIDITIEEGVQYSMPPLPPTEE